MGWIIALILLIIIFVQRSSANKKYNNLNQNFLKVQGEVNHYEKIMNELNGEIDKHDIEIDENSELETSAENINEYDEDHFIGPIKSEDDYIEYNKHLDQIPLKNIDDYVLETYHIPDNKIREQRIQKLLDKMVPYCYKDELFNLYRRICDIYKYMGKEDNKYYTLQIEYIKKCIALFPEAKKASTDRNLKIYGENPFTFADYDYYQELAIALERTQNYKEAIDVCKVALEHGARDSSKSGFQGRIKRLEKKLS
ncbi:MAG: hypothetical protein ACE3JK_10450 [Sporolactobacillus sp.]